MPTFNPALVPTVAPGNLFTSLTTDDTLNVRWLTAVDPVFFEALNRPLADTVLRQLVLAKSLDTLSTSIGHQAIFPFLIQAKVENDTAEADLPNGWIWDLHFSTPNKWENFRLAKIKRLSGVNGTGTDDYTGVLRLIFTANQEGSPAVEVSLFSADYMIDSTLTYQRLRLTVVTSAEESVVISAGESETIEGFITFRTLSTADPIVEAFYELVAPPANPTDTDGDGYYDTPAVYEIVDTVAGGTGVSNDFATTGVSHGTGMLVDSTNNTMPQLDSDIQSWINAFNYPFDADANRQSAGASGITIPVGLFREFDITAPAGDEPTDDTSGTYFPVWISRIELIGTANDTARLWFSTHNVTDEAPSLTPIEFARLDLQSTMSDGQIIEITPTDDLKLHIGSDDNLFQQHFGRGHVVLSSVWDGTSAAVQDFFDALALVVDGEVTYTQSATRLSSYAVSRVPKYVPTIGQNQALEGTTSLRTTAIPPSKDNLYVVEADQGQGDSVDLEADTDIAPHAAIDRYGYNGSLCHRMIRLCIDGTKLPTGTESGAGTFYEDEVLPRLRLLLGRDPQFGDIWYDGTRFFFYNGNAWQSS